MDKNSRFKVWNELVATLWLLNQNKPPILYGNHDAVVKTESVAEPQANLKTMQQSLAGKWQDYEFKNQIPCNLSSCTKRQIKKYFKNTYDLDELLFSAVKDERYFYMCPDRLRLPLIFYVPHPSCMYVNKMMLAGLIDKRVNSHFEKLFETGVDENAWDDTENYRMGGSFKWPSLHDVLEYRIKVRQVVNEVIDKTPLQLPVTQDSPWWSLFMGMEHERLHLETSSVLIRQLPVKALKKPGNWTYAPPMADYPPGPNKFVTVPRGTAVVGKPQDFPSYGWDNEYGRYTAEVPEFEATQYLVTNEEFLEFVKDKGYDRRELWTDEGWRWCKYRQAKHPTFWVCEDGCKSGCGADLASYSHCNNGIATNGHCNGKWSNGKTYKYRAIFDVIEMPWYWPVDVNYHEAKAFCAWKGPEYRLPTEAEHHRMRDEEEPTCDVSCDPAYDGQYPANHNLKYGSSTPVNMYPPTSKGFFDVFGNVWEWVEDHFNGLPGFKTNYLYDDFSTTACAGRHTMMLGGSWITTGASASRFYRLGFRRHFFQHLGFRMVRSTQSAPVRLCNVELFVLGAGVADNPVTVCGVDIQQSMMESTNSQFLYETKDKLQAQLQIEYGDVSNNFEYLKCIEESIQEEDSGRSNVVQFGSGTGYNSFLLTKLFDNVTAVEYSGRLMDSALKVQSGDPVPFGEGKAAVAPTGTKPEKVCFKQLTWVPNEIESYDVAVFEFIDRLSEPKGWLLKLWETVTSQGVVIFLVDPDSQWNEDKIGVIIGNRFNLKKKARVGKKMASVWKRKQ